MGRKVDKGMLARRAINAACVELLRSSAECVAGWWINIPQFLDFVQSVLNKHFQVAAPYFSRNVVGTAIKNATESVTGDHLLQVMSKCVTTPHGLMLQRKWVRFLISDINLEPIHPGRWLSLAGQRSATAATT